MAFDDLYVVNRMMIAIGQKRLSALGEDSKSQRLAEDVYDGIVKEVFELLAPKFATTRAELTALEAAPAFGYDYQYKLPSGCVRILETVDEDSNTVHYEYRREDYVHVENKKTVHDDVLLCDQEECFIRYIVLRTNSGRWPGWFTKVVYLTGAVELVTPIVGDDYRALRLENRLEKAIDEARAADGAEDMDVDATGRDVDSGEQNIADGIFTALSE